MLDFCRLKIEGDIESNVKNIIVANKYIYRFSSPKILPQSNQNISAEIAPPETYHIPNELKFNRDFNRLFRFEMTASFGGENLFLLSTFYAFTLSPHLFIK